VVRTSFVNALTVVGGPRLIDQLIRLATRLAVLRPISLNASCAPPVSLKDLKYLFPDHPVHPGSHQVQQFFISHVHVAYRYACRNLNSSLSICSTNVIAYRGASQPPYAPESDHVSARTTLRAALVLSIMAPARASLSVVPTA